MGSSSTSWTSNLIPTKLLNGTEDPSAGGGMGTVDILKDDPTEGIVVALINTTSAFMQQKVGTPVIVRNSQVFASEIYLGDIPSTLHQAIQNGTRGKVYNIENGQVCLYVS